MKDEKDRAKYIKDFYEQCDFSELIVNCDDQEEYHWQVIARILFIYAKLNPGQGMGFILEIFDLHYNLVQLIIINYIY